MKLIHPDCGRKRPPLCFKSQWQWDDWVVGEVEFHTGPNANGYCEHCTPAYKREMLNQGRCAHPRVRFLLSEDGFTGVRPAKRDVHWLRAEA